VTIQEFMVNFDIHSQEELSERTSLSADAADQLWYGKVSQSTSAHLRWRLRHTFEVISTSLGCDITDLVEAVRETRWRGWVYLIQSSIGIKIGKSKDPNTRLKSIPFNYPHIEGQFTLIHQILTNDTRMFERDLHQRYKESRIEGEWYDLTEDDIAVLKSVRRYHYKSTSW
jgi:hypothetical protein